MPWILINRQYHKINKIKLLSAGDSALEISNRIKINMNWKYWLDKKKEMALRKSDNFLFRNVQMFITRKNELPNKKIFFFKSLVLQIVNRKMLYRQSSLMIGSLSNGQVTKWIRRELWTYTWPLIQECHACNEFTTNKFW